MLIFQLILKYLKRIQKMLAKQYQSQGDPIGNVVSPLVVGGSIIALKCKQGIIIAHDTLLAYGGLLKYPDVKRVQKITDGIALAATGEFADFQEVTRKLNELTRQSQSFDDNVHFTVKDYANYLGRICYEQRNNQNPFYNNFVIAGFQNQEPFLASVDLYGSFIKNDYLTLGFAKHFGLAIIANEWNKQKPYTECKEILKKCFSILYMRACQAIDSIQFTFVGKDGVQTFQPERIQSNWDFKQFKERKNQNLWQ